MSSNAEKLDPFVVRLGEGEKSVAANMLVRRVATAGNTGGEFGLIEMSGVKGTGAPAHSHGTEAEAFIVVEGSLHVGVGDLEVHVHAGDFVYIPKQTRHKFTIESESARLLCLITPGGFEDFFVEMGEPTTNVFPPNIDELTEMAPREDAGKIIERFHLGFEQDW